MILVEVLGAFLDTTCAHESLGAAGGGGSGVGVPTHCSGLVSQRGGVDGDFRVELFPLFVNLVGSRVGGGYRCQDVADDYLHHLDLFIQASGKQWEVADGGFKCRFGREEVETAMN